MKDINYRIYNKLDSLAKVDYLIAFGIRKENAETLVYRLNRPLVFK